MVNISEPAVLDPLQHISADGDHRRDYGGYERRPGAELKPGNGSRRVKVTGLAVNRSTVGSIPTAATFPPEQRISEYSNLHCSCVKQPRKGVSTVRLRDSETFSVGVTGSTPDFGSGSRGSNPRQRAMKIRWRAMIRQHYKDPAHLATQRTGNPRGHRHHHNPHGPSTTAGKRPS